MAGHSKWANIKHRKGAQDKKKGKIFGKLSKAITIAAKSGGDPDANLSLKHAIDKARQANMPSANISNAIKKGTGELGDVILVELLYEGFGPGGVAVIVEAVSDNRNRTTPEIKKMFEKLGGNLGNQGSVSFMFSRQGIISMPGEGLDEDEVFEVLADAGAEDFEAVEGSYIVTTGPTDLHSVLRAIQGKGWEVETADIFWMPNTPVAVDPSKLAKLERFLEALEDHDDVQSVYSNAEDSEETEE